MISARTIKGYTNRMRLVGMTVIIISGLLLAGCNMSIKKSGVEIMSYPVAKVYLDGKESGMTPYKNNSLTPGETDIKLVTNEGEWTKKVHLENGANTVISREFAKDLSKSGGYVLYFEFTGDKKKAGLLISSTPDRAAVTIDDEIKGYSPLRIEDVGEGDKKLVVSYPGSKNVSSYVKFINGYQLVVDAELAKEEIVVVENNQPEETVPNNPKIENKVVIKETETGWLRVRSDEGGNGTEVGRVNPGEEYTLLEENNDWYKIDLGNGKSGWISAKYAEKSGAKIP